MDLKPPLINNSNNKKFYPILVNLEEIILAIGIWHIKIPCIEDKNYCDFKIYKKYKYINKNKLY